MLKSVSQIDQPSVEQYLIKNHAVMPRVAYRYALEKFDKDTPSTLYASDFLLTACSELSNVLAIS